MKETPLEPEAERDVIRGSRCTICGFETRSDRDYPNVKVNDYIYAMWRHLIEENHEPADGFTIEEDVHV